MEKRINAFLTNELPKILFVFIAAGAFLFIFFFFTATWRTLTASENLIVLRSEVAMESLDRTRFDRVLNQLKGKMGERTIDWKKLRDPF